MHFRQLADAEASLAIAQHGVAISNQFGATNVLAFQLCPTHAGFHSFNNKAAFQFGDRADNDDHGASQRAAGVDVLAKGYEADVEMMSSSSVSRKCRTERASLSNAQTTTTSKRPRRASLSMRSSPGRR